MAATLYSVGLLDLDALRLSLTVVYRRVLSSKATADEAGENLDI